MIDLQTFQPHFDRGAPRWKEALWLVLQLLFFAAPYPLPSKLRCALLRFFGASVGNGCVLRSGVRITFPWRLTIGDFVWIGEDVRILNLADVSIASNCCISQGAFLCTGSHRFDKTEFDLVTKPIIVHQSSWVAARVFVAPGVQIGPGSMCVAGSVVLKDVPPQTTVYGNPAVVKS